MKAIRYLSHFGLEAYSWEKVVIRNNDISLPGLWARADAAADRLVQAKGLSPAEAAALRQEVIDFLAEGEADRLVLVALDGRETRQFAFARAYVSVA